LGIEEELCKKLAEIKKLKEKALEEKKKNKEKRQEERENRDDFLEKEATILSKVQKEIYQYNKLGKKAKKEESIIGRLRGIIVDVDVESQGE